ncbi:MAG: hypothetical protein M1832_005416 [Thelocarpon impressellum]|nr:MAG: hypothetical protein M1832_005416 [Thelocarpon impressellum]
MSAQPSAACCSIPPVISKGYEPKGSFITVDGIKCYATGPPDASRGIVYIYDVFGYYPQTLQGADILAFSDTEHPYRVFIPDFLGGDYADITWYPPKTPETQAKLGAFFKDVAAPPKHLPRIAPFVEQLKKSAESVKSWGVLGTCWGAKLVTLAAGADTPFKAAAGAHPAMIDPADASKITIPLLFLPSKDEDAAAVKAFEAALKVPHRVETFADQLHGWMTARADLDDARVKAEYARGYELVLDFFHEHV